MSCTELAHTEYSFFSPHKINKWSFLAKHYTLNYRVVRNLVSDPKVKKVDPNFFLTLIFNPSTQFSETSIIVLHMKKATLLIFMCIQKMFYLSVIELLSLLIWSEGADSGSNRNYKE